MRTVVVRLPHGKHAHLHRREPQRERAAVVLGEDPDEPLEGAHDRPVDHDDLMLLVVVAHEGVSELLRHVVVELDRRQLPRAAE